jgi:hypothetical protein
MRTFDVDPSLSAWVVLQTEGVGSLFNPMDRREYHLAVFLGRDLTIEVAYHGPPISDEQYYLECRIWQSRRLSRLGFGLCRSARRQGLQQPWKKNGVGSASSELLNVVHGRLARAPDSSLMGTWIPVDDAGSKPETCPARE